MKQISQRYFLTLALAATLAGCVFSTLKQDLEKLQEIAHLFAGTVSTEGVEADAIVVVALRDPQGENVARILVMSGPGPFELRSDPTPTFFFAFDDLNKDLIFQVNEPYGWAAGGRALDASKEGTDNINIAISAASRNQAAFPQKLVDARFKNHLDNNLRFNVGTVSSLDNPLFSEEQATKGLWEPYGFIEDGGTGVHFLQPYDPDKIPVLFVPGINDTPRRFAAIIEQLDQSKYQAWVYSYPSGLRLTWLANGTHQFLEMLYRQYRFDELHVVAHSMGGLVSRGGLNLCTQNGSCKYLRSFTTLSTPWNGVESAQSGVKWAPTVVPVWRDLDPDSEYLTSLFDTPLPDGLPHHLLFGFRQNSIFGSESSDGVIKLTSQLRPAAQEQAQLIRGYDEDHVSIVSSETVVRKVHQILAKSSQ